MNTARGKYRCLLPLWPLFFLLTGAGHNAFSQQEADSINPIIGARDSAEDSIKRSAYNYYYSREEWTADSLQLRQVPDSIVKRLQANDDFWYANKDFKKKKEPVASQKTGFWDWLMVQQWYQALAWIIIMGGFVAVLIWFLAGNNVSLFRRRSKTIAAADHAEMPENIFEIDYAREIEKAVQATNYRLGVRLLFLRLLKVLSERNLIRYQQGKTNFDYLLQVTGSAYYNDFFRLTRNYEYTWYGEFALGPELFKTIRSDFERFEKQLN